MNTRGMLYVEHAHCYAILAERMLCEQFYNLVLFVSSVAVFSLVAQRLNGANAGK